MVNWLMSKSKPLRLGDRLVEADPGPGHLRRLVTRAAPPPHRPPRTRSPCRWSGRCRPSTARTRARWSRWSGCRRPVCRQCCRVGAGERRRPNRSNRRPRWIPTADEDPAAVPLDAVLLDALLRWMRCPTMRCWTLRCHWTSRRPPAGRPATIRRRRTDGGERQAVTTAPGGDGEAVVRCRPAYERSARSDHPSPTPAQPATRSSAAEACGSQFDVGVCAFLDVGQPAVGGDAVQPGACRPPAGPSGCASRRRWTAPSWPPIAAWP